MNTILCRLKEAFPFVGTKPATEDDLFGYCETERVTVEITPQIRSGLYVPFAGRDFIFLNSRLYGWPLRYVFAHEIGHQLFHVPTCSREQGFDDVHRSKNHIEAEAVAAYLLLPIAELERALIDGEFQRYDRLASLIALRLDLYSRDETQ